MLKTTGDEMITAVYERGTLSEILKKRLEDESDSFCHPVLFNLSENDDRSYGNVMSFTVLKEKVAQGKVNAVIIPDMDKKVRLVIERIYELESVPLYYASLNQVVVSKELELKSISRDKPWLDVMEYHVADHCNMNCKGCGHCANIIPDAEFPDINIYEKELIRLKELFDGIGLIRLLGGEPLLNVELSDYIKLTRCYFPFANLHIVTNGILLTEMPDRLVQILHDECVTVDISLYPPMHEHEDSIRSYLKEKDLLFVVEKIDTFYRRFTPFGGNDAAKSYAHCESSRNHLMNKGRIASCAMPYSIEILNRKYGYSIEHDAWIDLFDSSIDGWEINKRLDSESSLCSYCKDDLQSYKWEQKDAQNACESDWIFTE